MLMLGNNDAYYLHPKVCVVPVTCQGLNKLYDMLGLLPPSHFRELPLILGDNFF